MARFRWGIFGTGAVSQKFGLGLRYAQDAEVAFVASRSLARAEALAAQLSSPRAIQGYEKAAIAGGADAIYLATPPSEHVVHALLCVAAGVPVLVEKPFAATVEGAERIAAASRSAGVFAMEAMWTRFLPAARELHDKVASGTFGDVRMVTGSFGMSWTPEPVNGMFRPELGGGALAHLGPYPLSLAQWLFGSPRSVQAAGTVGASGVDEDVALLLEYPNDVIGSFLTTLRAWAPDDLHVLGTGGALSLRGGIVRPHGLMLRREDPLRSQRPSSGLTDRLRQSALVHRLAQELGRSGRQRGHRLTFRYAGNGYQYEAEEVRACLQRSELESSVMPLDDSLAVARTIDQARSLVHASQQV